MSQETILTSEICATDFTMVKRKLQDTEEGPGWSEELCEIVEGDYKRFLALKKHYPGRDVVPNKQVDLFWHQHILDTQQYESDCRKIFGYFLHHYPYFGMQGADDHTNLCAAFQDTTALYSLHFSAQQLAYPDRAAKCRTQCKPMKCR